MSSQAPRQTPRLSGCKSLPPAAGSGLAEVRCLSLRIYRCPVVWMSTRTWGGTASSRRNQPRVHNEVVSREQARHRQTAQACEAQQYHLESCGETAMPGKPRKKSSKLSRPDNANQYSLIFEVVLDLQGLTHDFCYWVT